MAGDEWLAIELPTGAEDSQPARWRITGRATLMAKSTTCVASTALVMKFFCPSMT